MVNLTTFQFDKPHLSESREDIRSAIPCIVGCLRHMVSFIRQAAIDGLSRLGAQCIDCVSAFPFDGLNLARS